MKSQSLPGTPVKTDDEYKQEADRLIAEIQEMQENTRLSRERGRQHTVVTKVLQEQLRQQLLCGKN